MKPQDAMTLGVAQEYINSAVAQLRSCYIPADGFSTDLSVIAHNCVDREAYLLEACTGKRVLHYGFVDAPAFAGLHLRIHDVATYVMGIDINAEAVAAYSLKTGDTDCAVGDVQDGQVVERDPRFDIILLPEVLEHVRNVEKALGTILANCAWHGCDALITVPNAFFLGNMFAAIEGREVVHEEHRCWFSPQTLKRCIADASLNLKELTFYSPSSMMATPGLTKSGIIARVSAKA